MKLVEYAAFSGDTLWLLSPTGFSRPCGRLFSLDVRNRRLTELHIPSSGRVERFLVLPGGKILVASSGRELWEYSSGKMKFVSSLPASPLPELWGRYGIGKNSTLRQLWESGMIKGKGNPAGDRIHHMIPDRSGIIILTPASVLRYDLMTDAWNVVCLQHLVPRGLMMSAFFPGDGYCYQGIWNGEDGGDLKRINITTGAVEILYEGTIPVTSLVQDPWHPGTALFSTGMWHTGWNEGGIFRATGDMEPVFSGGAVFSMKSGRESITAATPGGVFRICRDGSAERYDYPPYESYEGVELVSDPRFGTLVRTHIYQSMMVCGAAAIFPEGEQELSHVLRSLSESNND
jgi:hypothetical protein